MGGWRDTPTRQLKKVVYALDDHAINKLIEAHENRGWTKSSDVKEYNYGLGCLMTFKSRRFKDAETANKSNSH